VATVGVEETKGYCITWLAVRLQLAALSPMEDDVIEAFPGISRRRQDYTPEKFPLYLLYKPPDHSTAHSP